MTEIPRRSIEDLAVRYALEPDLQDIFVEGYFDQEIISNFISKSRNRNRIAYVIDGVDISNEVVERHGFTLGNKQRVIALARELQHLPSKCSFCFLVDKDLDHWFGPLETTHRLKWTEYCSLELYFWSESFLKDIFIKMAKCKIDNWDVFYQSLIDTLQFKYLLRLADHELKYHIKWISLSKYIKINNNSILFNHDDYIDRVLQQNSKYQFKNSFIESISKWRNKLVADNRMQIHGHDFIEIIALTIIKCNGVKHFANEEALYRILVFTCDKANEISKLI